MSDTTTLSPAAADSASAVTSTTAIDGGAVIPLSTVIATQVRERIEGLASSREAWESGTYARSNDVLYGLIRDCFVLYKELTEKSDMAKIKRRGLEDYIARKGYSVKSDTPLTAKLIRCVFAGIDRRRLSTYHSVLRVAVAQNWKPNDFGAEIARLGGVQEISLSKHGTGSKPMTPKQKAEAAKCHVLAQCLASVSSPQLSKRVSPDGIGANVAAILTQEADGSFTLNALVNSQAAVNAALAAYFGAHKGELKVTHVQAAITREQTSREQMIDVAVQAVANG